jgi:hypothetical protein
MSNLNSEILIYGMSSRSLHTVRPFWVNYCHSIIMMAILLQKCIPSYGLRNIFYVNSFISELEGLTL